MCDFKMCDVRRCGAHPYQTYLNVAELDKNVFKTSEISVILISLKNEEKKLRERKEKKQRRQDIKKVERYLKSISFTTKCAKRKFRKKYGKECAN